MSLLKRSYQGAEDEDLVLGLWGWNGAEHMAGCSGGQRHCDVLRCVWDAGDSGVGGGHWKRRTQISCSMVTEKPVSPYTLFLEESEASFFFFHWRQFLT